ncbi:hypothetical protein [Streptomyces triticisoli]|uniref:hypothetical protein n=1 Tax=Streptomyces triticisoli TaxID=2182797 RepID=UPI000DD84E96|nr:hypothetical protein [Streptomyces triticisoli]
MSSAEPEETELDEPGGMSERTAHLILAAVLLLAMWGIVAAVPETAYVVVGVLLCLAWQRVAGWLAARRQDDEDEPAAEETPDVAEALRTLSNGGQHVLLTQLQKTLAVPDTKTVRALLKTAGIRVRAGVRTPAGNGPGVHRDDIPAPSLTESGPHSEGCCCRSGNNANANNAPTGPTEEGLRVEPIGLAGAVVRDPADAVRHHQVGGK